MGRKLVSYLIIKFINYILCNFETKHFLDIKINTFLCQCVNISVSLIVVVPKFNAAPIWDCHSALFNLLITCILVSSEMRFLVAASDIGKPNAACNYGESHNSNKRSLNRKSAVLLYFVLFHYTQRHTRHTNIRVDLLAWFTNIRLCWETLRLCRDRKQSSK